jgi:tetratricopeptide (TPR) repeat protein
MAQQKQVYQQAMSEAADAAWDHDWARATTAYRQALDLAPDDPQALAGLALSLLETNQHDAALDMYQRVAKLVPGDPLPHEKMASIYQRRSAPRQAAYHAMKAGEIYFARGNLERAIPNWEQAVAIDLDQAKAHMRLATAYEQGGNRQRAVIEYLHVARLLQEMKQIARAERALQRAANLDPLNPEVRSATDDLRNRRPIPLPTPYRPEGEEKEARAGRPLSPDAEQEELIKLADKPPAYSPVDTVARYAMSQLADMIWSGEVPASSQGDLLRAIDLHQVGDAKGALEAYNRVYEAGVDHPALLFNRAVMLHYAGHTDDSLRELNEIAGDPDYAIAGQLLQGQIFLERGNAMRAAQHSLRALQAADMQVNEEGADAVGYERMIANLVNQPEADLPEIARAVARYLDDDNWQEKLREVLASYAARDRGSYVPDLVELLMEGGRPELHRLIERINTFLQQERLHLAIEEVHYAIARVPDYLPAHRALADILLLEKRNQEAAQKLNLVANTYLVRGHMEKAADLFAEAIDVWPADTSARRRVIGMLKEQGRASEALRHYAELGSLYYRLMADPDQATQVYDEAMAYAQEVDAPPEARMPVLKALADIESQRLNWRHALDYYEQAADIDPSDDDVRMAVIDLRFQLGNTQGAIEALDGYLGYLVQSGRMNHIVSVLKEQVRQRPDEMPLRQRLAEVYRQQGRRQEAIAELDALGELQLDAGDIGAALTTIRKIVALNPPDVESYRKLLKQLQSGGY